MASTRLETEVQKQVRRQPGEADAKGAEPQPGEADAKGAEPMAEVSVSGKTQGTQL